MCLTELCVCMDSCRFRITSGKGRCKGTLQINQVNGTTVADLSGSGIKCKGLGNLTDVEVYTYSGPCDELKITVDAYQQGREYILSHAIIEPKDIPCPILGFDIDCPPNCAPGGVEDGKCLCNVACFLGVNSWEDCGKLSDFR